MKIKTSEIENVLIIVRTLVEEYNPNLLARFMIEPHTVIKEILSWPEEDITRSRYILEKVGELLIEE